MEVQVGVKETYEIERRSLEATLERVSFTLVFGQPEDLDLLELSRCATSFEGCAIDTPIINNDDLVFVANEVEGTRRLAGGLIDHISFIVSWQYQ